MIEIMIDEMVTVRDNVMWYHLSEMLF